MVEFFYCPQGLRPIIAHESQFGPQQAVTSKNFSNDRTKNIAD